MIRPDIDALDKKLAKHDTIEHADAVELIEYILYLEAQDRRRDWPTELHEQYLVVLDERDALQEQIDIYARILEDMPTDDLFEIYKEEYEECEHDWDSGDYSDGIGATGPGTFYICRKCGLEQDG